MGHPEPVEGPHHQGEASQPRAAARVKRRSAEDTPDCGTLCGLELDPAVQWVSGAKPRSGRAVLEPHTKWLGVVVGGLGLMAGAGTWLGPRIGKASGVTIDAATVPQPISVAADPTTQDRETHLRSVAEGQLKDVPVFDFAAHRTAQRGDEPVLDEERKNDAQPLFAFCANVSAPAVLALGTQEPAGVIYELTEETRGQIEAAQCQPELLLNAPNAPRRPIRAPFSSTMKGALPNPDEVVARWQDQTLSVRRVYRDQRAILELVMNGRTQTLQVTEIPPPGVEAEMYGDWGWSVRWVGDVDDDARADLVLVVLGHGVGAVLFTSGSAKNGELLGKRAETSWGGC
jgi:hypothetical protein